MMDGGFLRDGEKFRDGGEGEEEKESKRREKRKLVMEGEIGGEKEGSDDGC